LGFDENQLAERRQLPKDKRGIASAAELAAQRTQLAKAARDRELSRRQKKQADKRAGHAQIEQLIEQNRLARVETERDAHAVIGCGAAHDAASADRVIGT